MGSSRTLFAVVAILALLTGCHAQSNKASFLRAVHAINDRDLASLDDLIAIDYVRHSQATPDVQVRSLDEFKRFLRDDFAAIPDSLMTIDLLVAEGDLLAFWGTYAGTQTGQMGPLPPSGRRMVLDFSGVHRFENGEIAETWIVWDNLSAMTQLGFFPPPSREGN